MSLIIVRVYGIHIENGKLLVCDERINGIEMTKFPGGGLEYGEGTRDCLIREMREEMNAEIDILEHIYTTDFFQASAFNPNAQIISIYYGFRFQNNPPITYASRPFEFDKTNENQLKFRWIEIDSHAPMDITISQLTFPIDRKVVELILQKSR